MKTTEQDLAHYRAVYRENGGLSKSAAEDVLDDLDSALAQLATEREARERAEQAHKYAHGVSEDWRSKHANALHEADALRAEVARKDAALEKLRYLAGRITGKVCDDYENCNHEACDASCHAHLIALEMRGDIGAALAPPGRDLLQVPQPRRRVAARAFQDEAPDLPFLRVGRHHANARGCERQAGARPRRAPGAGRMTPIDAKVNDLLILALHEKRHALQRARRMWSLTPEAEQLLTAVLAKIDELEALEKAPGARPESASVLAERYGFKPRAASGGEALGRDLGHVDAARPEPQAQKTSEEQQRDGLGLAPSQLDHSRPAEASEEPGTSDSAERVAREFCQKHIREFYETSTSSIRFCHELALLLRSDPLGLREQGWNEAVEACAKRFASDWLCLDHGGEEQELIIARCLELARPAARGDE